MEAIWIKAQKVLIQAISRPFCGRLSLVFRMTVAAGIQAVKIIEKITDAVFGVGGFDKGTVLGADRDHLIVRRSDFTLM